MALSPLSKPEDRYIDTTTVIEPSKTYQIDFDSEYVGGYVDELAAVKQFIQKALLTDRGNYLIYSDQYGSDLYRLIGSDVTTEYLEAIIPEYIRDALMIDDRISDVSNFSITKEPDSDAVFVTFDVNTIYGTTSESLEVSV